MASVDTFSPNPYMLLDSFEERDADRFFGRDQVSGQVLARIMAHQLTVIHARSGTGKSSLLMARTIPELFRRCFIPVRVTPNPSPIDRIREGVVDTLLPPPGQEQECLQQAWHAAGKPTTVGDLTAWIQAHPRAFDAAHLSTWTARLLRGGLAFEDFIDHLSALYAAGHARTPSLEVAHGNMEVADLFDVLTDTVKGHDQIRTVLPAPSDGLRSFFESLNETYGRHRARFRVVLVIDQFEEVFTAGGGGRSPDAWRRKWQLFDELRDIWRPRPAGPVSGESEDGVRAADPPARDVSALLRFVIALRSDYLADLEPLRAFTELDDATFHLPLLAPIEAGLAVIGPPKQRFDLDGIESLANVVVGALTREERFVDPPELQVVCYTLWEEWAGTGTRETAAAGLLAALDKLGGPEGIVDGFLARKLALLGSDALLAVDMLGALITPSGTRNISESHALVHRPFQNPSQRTAVLTFLIDQKLVRKERRLGGDFVEIAHEFLVQSILKVVNSHRATLRSIEISTRALERVTEDGSEGFEAVEWACIEESVPHLVLPLWAFEAMLEAALRLPHDVSTAAASRWLERYRIAEGIAIQKLGRTAPSALRFSVSGGPHAGLSVVDAGIAAGADDGTEPPLSLVEWRLRAQTSGRDAPRECARLVLSGVKVAVPGTDDALLRQCAERWVTTWTTSR